MMKTTARAFGLGHLAFSLALIPTALACGASPVDSRFPPRPEGCTVEVFHEIAPTKQTENIGPVRASCTELVSKDDCLRTLQDQVCKLGGDVVWGVEPEPVIRNGRKTLSGRAAKTR